MEWWSEGLEYWNNQVTARWNNVSPGTCCKPHPSEMPTLRYNRAGETRFLGLQQNQFGAGWAATGFAHADIINCTGAPMLRVFGPGTGDDNSIIVYNPPWEDEGEVDGTPQNVVFAASWVDLRTRFPPDSAGSRYLQWQGVKGAIWGRGTWSAASDGIPFPKRRRRDWMPRLNGKADRGMAYISPPSKWVYPDVYTVNGTDYALQGNGTYVSRLEKSLESWSTVGR
ncbi:MAG: hypothetical protein L6R41_007250 [Letrouitia leprolyta]|nr:MAG: hypothetical protein L6R41_007250 [Letrouitia leprolyta]